MNAKQKLQKFMAAQNKLKDFSVRWANGDFLVVTASFPGELAARMLALEPDGWRLVRFRQGTGDQMTGEFELVEDNQDETTRQD